MFNGCVYNTDCHLIASDDQGFQIIMLRGTYMINCYFAWIFNSTAGIIKLIGYCLPLCEIVAL